MKKRTKLWLNLISGILLALLSVGCSGGGSSSIATLESFSVTVSEKAVAGDAVGTITILDAGSSAITAITLSGTGNENFAVSTSGAITVKSGAALDYETTASYTLSAVATNATGDSTGVVVTINISDYYNPFQIAKIQANDAEADDNFGRSVSISGDYVVVGAPYEDTGGTDAGSAYLYKKDVDGTLTQIAKIQADDAEVGDSFGNSVSISGDYIVVGAYAEDTNGVDAGSAYIFKRNSDTNVTQMVKIGAVDAEAADRFGYSVSISGNYIVVGANYEDPDCLRSAGSAYIFKRNSDTNVTQIAKINASDAEAIDYFGCSVSISGDYIVVGAFGEVTRAGSVYIFKLESTSFSEATLKAKIQADDAEAGDYFGYSVSISGDYIAVGAILEDTGGTNSGSAYIFKRNSDAIDDVTQIAKIQADDAEADDLFGYSVSIDGNYIAVGANVEDSSGISNAGSAYIFKRNSDTDVTQIAKINASDAEAIDYFGCSVSIDADSIVVGATGGTNAGSTYVFDMEPIEKPYIRNTPTSVISHDESLSNTFIYSFEGASPVGGEITYTIGGADGDDFSFVDNNLSFTSSTDFEIPTDSDVSNDYNLTITATDANSNQTTIDADISVKDKIYLDLAKIQASDAEAFDYFGRSVSVSGDYIVVGAHYEDTTASDAGSAYLYKKEIDGSLTQIAKIQADDAEVDDWFGYAVSISGDYIAVGAYHEDTNGSNAGSVYIFKRNSDTSVTQIAKIQADDAQASDWFGWSVSISGDYIAVGAKYEDTNGTDAGSAYIFKRNSDTNVTQIAKIGASDAETGDWFGYSLSISGDYIAVGAHGEDTNGTDAGSAYIFKRNSDITNDVTQIAKIGASDPEAYDYFGISVSISGDYIAVGAHNEDTGANNTGSVYIFKRNSDTTDDVTQIAKIGASDAQASDWFGWSVSISGDNIAVGAYGTDTDGTDAGSAYIFKRNSDTNVTQVVKIEASDAEVDDNFGYAVSIDGDNLVVGANRESSDTGAAYIFVKDANQP